ncbi:MAG: hypothetical protein ABJB97_03740 [Acidobacteriota bacterium]
MWGELVRRTPQLSQPELSALNPYFKPIDPQSLPEVPMSTATTMTDKVRISAHASAYGSGETRLTAWLKDRIES